MQVPGRVLMICFAAVFALSACAEGDPQLMNMRSTTAGPDEFAILPNRKLEMPKDLAALPDPEPGEPNLADPNPKASAVAALGGNPDQLKSKTVRSSETGLLKYANRYGARTGIREELAAADLEFRKRNRGLPLERWANVNVYYKAYEPFTLDSYGELERFQRAGVRTVAAPPKKLPEDDTK